MEVGDSIACGSYEKYLDLPVIVERSKYKSFRVLKDKSVAKDHRLEEQFFLSQVGKEELIKAVL